MQKTLAIFACALGLSAAFSASSYEHSHRVSDDIKMYWNIVGSGSSQKIQLALQYKTTKGWMGFGISESTSGSMPGSDIMVAYVTKDDELVVEDRYSFAFDTPELDPCENNWEADKFTRANGKTIIEFSRKLAVEDTQHDRPIQKNGNPTKLIFAYGSSSTFGYHGTKHATASINLFSPNTEPLDAVSDDSKFELRQDNFPIPTDETTYDHSLCHIFADGEVPEGTTMTGISMYVTPGNEPYIHHIVVSGLFDDNCDTDQYNNIWATASNQPFVLPSDVGFDLAQFKGIMVEIHYNNPDGDDGVIDTSGIDIYYTSTARTHKAAIVQFGDPSVALRDEHLPAGLSSYTFSCPASSTKKWSTDLKVFASFLHMHKSGVKMFTQQFRGGELIRTTNEVEYYDFAMQQTTELETLVFKRGDSFKTTCFYRNDDNTRVFGLGSENEMCIDFVYYYPAQDMLEGSVCGYDLGGDLDDSQSDLEDSALDLSFGTDDSSYCDKTDDSASQLTGLLSLCVVAIISFIF
eukprot:c8177_g1_i2.p1 GENE.c8177_g1_i2~~c8177_g1_i2.p1  ORF type:complete len:531 (+),score=129.00 c8177_g1_i2:35-1594(+)